MLAHIYMNTARRDSMHTADREEDTQCPCDGGMHTVENVMSECDYVVTYLGEMIDTVSGAHAMYSHNPKWHNESG